MSRCCSKFFSMSGMVRPSVMLAATLRDYGANWSKNQSECCVLVLPLAPLPRRLSPGIGLAYISNNSFCAPCSMLTASRSASSASFTLPCLSRSPKSTGRQPTFSPGPSRLQTGRVREPTRCFVPLSSWARSWAAVSFTKMAFSLSSRCLFISLNVLTMFDISSACYCFSLNACDMSSFRVL